MMMITMKMNVIDSTVIVYCLKFVTYCINLVLKHGLHGNKLQCP